MNEMYSEVREHLRRQHAMNTQEIHGKRLDNFPKYSYYGVDEDSGNTTRNSSKAFLFKVKILLFLLCVMLFSCYIYGGQDIKKGAAMAWKDMNSQITRLEEEEPLVKEAMGYCRKGYHWLKELTNQ